MQLEDRACEEATQQHAQQARRHPGEAPAPAAEDPDVVLLGEVTREERDAEGRAEAIDLDDKGTAAAPMAQVEASASDSGDDESEADDSEAEAVGGGDPMAMPMQPLSDSQFILTQDTE